MMKVAALALALLPLVQGGGLTLYCSNEIMYMCGDQLSGENMCEPPGQVEGYVHLVHDGQQCKEYIRLTQEKDQSIFDVECPTYVDPDTNEVAAGGTFDFYTEYSMGRGLRCEQGKECGFCECTAEDGKCGGDPHFSTYDGTQYSYHGECDLVMAKSQHVGKGLTLDLHARTKGMGSWSVIQSAALRIGDDIFEFENDGTHYINGFSRPLPYRMAGKFEVTKKRVVNEIKKPDGSIQTIDKTIATIDFGDGKEIRFTRLGKGIMYVKVNVRLQGTEGMLGTYQTPGLVGRGGVLLSDGDEMGEHWQVNGDEPMLFREARAPQWPEKCIPPKISATQRRLKMTDTEIQTAQQVCDKVDDDHRMFCIEDVLLSGDVNSADAYVFGEAF